MFTGIREVAYPLTTPQKLETQMTVPDAVRSRYGRQGACLRWAMEEDRTAATQPMRDGQRAKWARQVDPDGTLSPDELEYRIGLLQKAHMLKMTAAASKARRLAREARQSTSADREVA
jgi:hypothetical protein